MPTRFKGTYEFPKSTLTTYMYLPHQLAQILRRPPRLREADASFDALQELAGDLVAEDVRLLFAAIAGLVQFLARGTLVDAHHGHADGPGGLADAEGQVLVVGLDVAALLRRAHDLADRPQQRRVQRVRRLELPEHGRQVAHDGQVGGVRLFARAGGFHGRVAGLQRVVPFVEDKGEVRGQLAVEELVFGRVRLREGFWDE